jgi:hypothetical protein
VCLVRISGAHFTNSQLGINWSTELEKRQTSDPVNASSLPTAVLLTITEQDQRAYFQEPPSLPQELLWTVVFASG